MSDELGAFLITAELDDVVFVVTECHVPIGGIVIDQPSTGCGAILLTGEVMA